MRKLMMLAAMLAMVLVAAAPALGQATAVDDSNDTSYEDSFNEICPQVVAAFGAQTNYGDANAAATDDSDAAAVVAQDFGLSVEQVNACLGGVAAGNDVNGDDDDDVVVEEDDGDTVVVAGDDDGTASASASGSASASASSSASASASSSASASASSSASASAATAVLPATGGSSLLALGAGALLVAGGLLARRIVR